MNITKTLTTAAIVVLVHTGATAQETRVNADNTIRNQQDRSAGSKTPMEQSNESGDRKITAKIRQMIIKDRHLSMNAKNCKIITARGSVTLRGPVQTEAEKAVIEGYAEKVAGKQHVDNHLQIKR